MMYSTAILAAVLGLAAPLGSSGFSVIGSRAVVRTARASGSVSVNKKSHSKGCNCASCSGTRTCAPGCGCPGCARGGVFSLFMSSIVEDEASEPVAAEPVPAEVEAMDGVASEEEAHNVDRPARGSGIHKHKDGDDADRVELKDLVVGAEILAKVKTITAYGAFLDIGAKSDALVHVSRLSDDFVSNVEDVLTRGEDVTVRILSVDLDKSQVAVTMRSAEAEARATAPGGGRPRGARKDRPRRSGADQAAQAGSIAALATKGFDDGKFVDGTVVSTLDFGAFVRLDTAQLGEGLEGEVDGLCHISALAEGRTNSVSDVVDVGQEVKIRIRAVDTDAGRISLSMITKEQEEASRPARRERKGGGDGGDPVGSSWKDTGAKDWKEQLEEFGKTQGGFTNTAVIAQKL